MMDITWDHLPLGDIPRENGALGEYHCIRPDPRYQGWVEPTNHWSWRGSNWRLSQGQAGRELEQLHHSRSNNTIIVTDAVQRGVRRVEAEARCDDRFGEAGLVLGFRTALDYLCLHLDGGRVKLCRRRGEHFDLLAESGPLEPAGRWLKLSVHRAGGRAACSLDGQELFALHLPGGMDGQVGLLANVPARFRNLRAEGKPPRRLRTRTRRGYPPMKVLRKIDLRGFGTSRQIRFGNLTGDPGAGAPRRNQSRRGPLPGLDMVLAQARPLQVQQSYSTPGALTAINADGQVLWQTGKPVERPMMLPGDLPFQIHDVDGDGKAEVVCVRDFQIQYLDGATGRVKLSAPVPDRPPSEPLLHHVVTYFGSPTGEDLPRAWINAVAFADLTGRGTPRDLLLKDAYHHLWAYSAELEPLWSFRGNLGHFPFAADFNGDGRDEVVIGYHTLSAEGKIIENLHFGDHADAVFAGDPQGWGEPKVIRAGGDDGFLISGLRGDVLVIHHGHVQRLSIGNFRPEHAGLEYAICTYWGAPGIVALIDSAGKLLWSRPYPVCGNTLQPVNWTGDGRELIYFSAHPTHGGLYDAAGERAVAFPDDGHPELCSEVLDLLGTGRDNLIVWDHEAMWIYGPAGAPPAGRRYAPLRPALHNWSNYMAYWSIPRFVDE